MNFTWVYLKGGIKSEDGKFLGKRNFLEGLKRKVGIFIGRDQKHINPKRNELSLKINHRVPQRNELSLKINQSPTLTVP